MASIPAVYSKSLTSYDLLKSFAVIIMVIDHVGYYFFPDDLWWRAVGRIGFPIWFFLVGHASGRGIPNKLTIAALSLVALDICTGMWPLPLNALVTIICIRLLIDPVMNFCLKSNLNMWGTSIILMLLVLPSMQVMEYGTLGLLTAMFGYLVRHRDMLKEKFGHDKLVFQFMIFAYLCFIISMQMLFGFSEAEFAFMAVGTFCVRFYLYDFFKKESYEGLTKTLGKPLSWPLQFMGRRTLEIYVVHLFALQLLAMYVFQAFPPS